MADEKKVTTVAEPKTALKIPCIIERKYSKDPETGECFKYLSVSCLYHDEVFRFKIANDSKFFEYLMKNDGYLVTDSNDDIVSDEELANVKDYAAGVKAKFGV